MSDEATTDAEDPVREAAKLLGTLLIARRDVKAVEFPGGWAPDKSKFTLGDFRNHLKGDRCLGTYLLDEENRVKFIAFDIDLKRDCPYYVVEPIEQIEARMAANEYEAWRAARNDKDIADGLIDLIDRVGNLEAALHDHAHEGYAWARIRLMGVVEQLRKAVDQALGLKPLMIVTGGGAHVIVPFGDLVPAAEARTLSRSVMETMAFWEPRNDNFWTPERATPDPANLRKTYTHYSVEIECFPKQDIVKNEGGLGNLLRLPFGRHLGTGIRTFALADCSWNFPTMKLNKLHPLAALRDVAASLGVNA